MCSALCHYVFKQWFSGSDWISFGSKKQNWYLQPVTLPLLMPLMILLVVYMCGNDRIIFPAAERKLFFFNCLKASLRIQDIWVMYKSDRYGIFKGPVPIPILGSKKMPISDTLYNTMKIWKYIYIYTQYMYWVIATNICNEGRVSCILTNFIQNISALNSKHFTY